MSSVTRTNTIIRIIWDVVSEAVNPGGKNLMAMEIAKANIIRPRSMVWDAWRTVADFSEIRTPPLAARRVVRKHKTSTTEKRLMGL